MVDKGVSWNVGKVFFRDEQVYRFDLLPEPGHERPAFINLQQYYVEGYLVERAAELPLIDLRWNNKVTGHRAARRRRGADRRDARGRRTRCTPTTWPPATARAPTCASCWARRAKGRIFRDRFLIADVTHGRRPADRALASGSTRPSIPDQSVLLHKQADGMWRIDFQLGWDADPVRRTQAREHHRRACGRCSTASGCEGVQFEHRLGQRLHLRLPAHGALPPRPRAVRGRLGARRVAVRRARRQLRRAGRGQPRLEARGGAAAATRPTRCSTATPASASSRPTRTSAIPRAPPTSSRPRARSAALFRDAVLDAGQAPRLCARAGQQRAAVGGRRTLRDSPLNTADAEAFAGLMVPGAAAADAPPCGADGSTGWLLRALVRHRAPRGSPHWSSARARRPSAASQALTPSDVPLHVVHVDGGGAAANSPPSATTRSPAPSTCCGPTSTFARAGARPTAANIRAAHRPRTGQGREHHAAAPDHHRTEPRSARRLLRSAHRGASRACRTEESHAFNARLVLVLANHIGSTGRAARRPSRRRLPARLHAFRTPQRDFRSP